MKNKLFQYIDRNPSEKEREICRRRQLKIEDLTNSKSMMGLVGLKNLGNTCFLNSILQCVSNTEPLIKYFLNEIFVFYLNQTSIYGSKGKLAIAYGDFITAMYVGDQSYIAPWDIKRIISQKANQFMGFTQHDSQELLSVLLETLHEDVNAVTIKPYIQYDDSNQDKQDSEVSK